MARAILYRPNGEIRHCSCCGPYETWDSDFQIIYYLDEDKLIQIAVEWILSMTVHAKWEIKLLPGLDDEAEIDLSPESEKKLQGRIQDHFDKKKQKEEEKIKAREKTLAEQKAFEERQTYEILKKKFGD